MTTVQLLTSCGEVEAQVAADLNITWETPSTPAHPDDYVIINGSRMVRPYFFEFLAHVKRRWEGKTVVDLFAQEFRQRPREYYEEAVKLGRIRVEGKMVVPSYVVRDSQTMSHFVHRHEPPVIAGAVTVLEEGPDVITVCKPASVPVHPCGQYRKNTVMSILEAEHKTGPLFRILPGSPLESLVHPLHDLKLSALRKPSLNQACDVCFIFSEDDIKLLHYWNLGKAVHRLDRLVSGLLILARNSRTADFFRQEIEAGVVQKQYVAKVKGVFPAEEVELNAPVLYDPREGRSYVEVQTPAEEVGEALEEASRKTYGTDAKGKESCARFQRLSTNGVESIVRCMPQTGRTHQIRVHLQHLGFPIANDALYLHSNVAKRSKRNTTADRAAKLTAEKTSATTADDEELGLRTTCVTSASEGEVTCGSEGEQQEVSMSNEDGDCQRSDVAQDESLKPTMSDFVVDPLCTHCPNLEPSGYVGDDEGLWLHCIRYSGTNWVYECPLPQWAL